MSVTPMTRLMKMKKLRNYRSINRERKQRLISERNLAKECHRIRIMYDDPLEAQEALIKKKLIPDVRLIGTKRLSQDKQLRTENPHLKEIYGGNKGTKS